MQGQRFGGYSHLFLLFVDLFYCLLITSVVVKGSRIKTMCLRALPPKIVKFVDTQMLLMESYAKVRKGSVLTMSCAEIYTGVALSSSTKLVCACVESRKDSRQKLCIDDC